MVLHAHFEIEAQWCREMRFSKCPADIKTPGLSTSVECKLYFSLSIIFVQPIFNIRVFSFVA